MALTVSMKTDTTADITIATISGDAGNDDLVVDLAATLSDIAAKERLIVDLSAADHVTDHHLEQLIDNTPPNVVVVHPHAPIHETGRVVASLPDARGLEYQPTPRHGGAPGCTS